jgi:hypothetical protein
MKRGVADSAPVQWRVPRTAFWIAAPLVAASLAVLYYADPSTSAFYPACPLRAMTGLLCPGCGTTRALHALLHGQFATAFRFNPMLFITAAALTPAVVSLLRGRTPRYLGQPWFACCATIAVVGWWIVRNL